MSTEQFGHKSDFERQLERFSTLTIAGKDKSPESATVVKVTEITPPQDRIKNPRRLVFAQAFVHSLKTYAQTLRQLYKDGRSTLTFDHPRAGGELPDLQPDELEAVKEFAKNAPEEVRAAQILLGILESKNELQTDVLTHSRGLAYTAVAALIDDVRAKKEGRPNRIRNIVASGPVGLIGDDTLVDLTKRTLSEDSEQINWGPDWGGPGITMEQMAQQVSEERADKVRLGELPPETVTDPSKIFEELSAKKIAAEARGITEYGPADAAGIETAKEVADLVGSEGKEYAFGRLDSGAKTGAGWLARIGQIPQATQGLTRTLREARGISKTKLHDVLPKLREMGIEVAIIRGTDDKVFPTERIAHYMKTLRELGVLDISIAGVHDTLNRDPRAAHILEGFFQQLENNREKPKTTGTSG